MKAVASWSGGKDSCYAYCLAKQQGHQITSLITMMLNEEKSNFHLIPAAILDAQATALNVPLLKKTTSAQTYEADFKTTLSDFKKQGIDALVTGDIREITGHEANWLERILEEVDLKAIKPLWMKDTNKIYLDYITTGLKATVVRTNPNLNSDWLGRVLDRQFYDDILKLPGIDPCGENGEYHTVITDGPDFKTKVEIVAAEKKRLDNGSGYLEIKNFKITPK